MRDDSKRKPFGPLKRKGRRSLVQVQSKAF
jgi:hypothetical protein